jgi:hypothetical protein
MTRKILITLLVVLLAGGGAAFAEFGSGNLLSFTTDENGDNDDQFAVADPILDDENGDNGEGENGDEENGDEENGDEENGDEENGDENESDLEEDNGDSRSAVAVAVHEALSGDPDIVPGSEGFGAAVSERARDKEIHLGEIVSAAAREANGSAAKGNSGGNAGKSNGNGNGKPK